MREADAETENVMTVVQTMELRQQCGKSDSEEDPEEHQENRLYDEIYQDSELVMTEEPEEVSGLEIYEESDEDPVDAIVEVSEEDPEEEIQEEIYEETECELEDEVYEEPDENPEEETDEENSEEEIDEGSDEEKSVENSNLSLLTANVEDLELRQGNNSTKHVKRSSGLGKMTLEDCESQKMIQNDENLNFKSDDTIVTSEFDSKIGLTTVKFNVDCASKQQEHVISYRKHRRSRWDLRAEEGTALSAGTSKRRKTRWDNDDSRNFLYQVSSSLELSTDQEVLRLKKRLMEINKMLQCSEINGKETAKEICPPKPDNDNHGMMINARARRKLKKTQRNILCHLATLLSCKTPCTFMKKIFVPVGEYPTYKFTGLILGPKGNTQKRMEKETGAKIRLRGKGFGDPSEAEELHVLVEADNQRALDAAVAMVEKLLVPVADEINEHKRAQLTELAKLRGTFKDQNTCQLCKEQGHKQYACPLKDSSFNAACCDTCGSFDHPTSKCKSNKEVDISTLYVGYLPKVADEKWLKEIFSPFGKIIRTAVIKDPKTGLSKGYGFVEFDDSTDASAAVTYMNGYTMAGKILAVRIAGQKPVPAPAPTVAPSVVYGQTTNINGPEPSVFPKAQVSISSSKSLYFPYPSGTVARTVSLTISPPYTATTSIYPRMDDKFFSSPEFPFQNASSVSDSETSQFCCNPDNRSEFKTHCTSSKFIRYFTNPAMVEFGTFNQMTETDQNLKFEQGS